MTILGTKQISFSERKKIYRTTPRAVRPYDKQDSTSAPHYELINAFTRQEYILYEELLHTHGKQGQKRKTLYNHCINNNISGHILELVNIRMTNITVHQKLIAMLRLRWTRIHSINKEKLNNDVDKLWLQMATGIQSRCKKQSYELYPDWQGVEGRTRLVEFLKQRYLEQDGRCAISGEPLTLESGVVGKKTNKCSPDRKSSNRGYNPTNLWLIAWWVNSMKMELSLITFYKRINTIETFRNNQKS